MSMSEAMRQMPAQAGRVGGARGEAAGELASDEAESPRHDPRDTGNPRAALLHAAFTRENLQRALERVKANKGAAGDDGLDIDQTATYLVTAWPGIRERLLSGSYRPSPVRRVTIPKPDGGERELGIPTVVERLIQQATAASAATDSRPYLQRAQLRLPAGTACAGRGIGRASARAVRFAGRGGRGLGEVLDRVNHDTLIDRLSKRIEDPEAFG
jgi:RNA-directed DNA polymerase